MRYLDTNILTRLITNDQPEITPKVVEFIRAQKKDSLIIEDAILVELCFVLQYNRYKMARPIIFEAIQSILGIPQITASKYTKQAVELYGRYDHLDYTDCLLMATSEITQVEVVTLDKKLKDLIGEKAIEPQ
jgi:predicted nucleic-acid-binding protein